VESSAGFLKAGQHQGLNPVKISAFMLGAAERLFERGAHSDTLSTIIALFGLNALP
jgi:hypothetical protein